MANYWKSELSGDLLTFPAADRNKEPILEILTRYLPAGDAPVKLLEISSGTGQHASYFATARPRLRIQPTEYDAECLAAIAARQSRQECNPHGNILPPLRVDVSLPLSEWPKEITDHAGEWDLMMCTNLIHVSPWECSVGLFRAAGSLLKPSSGLLLTYGAYAVDGRLEPESNRNFDASIRARNSAWGVRDLTQDLKPLAAQYGVELVTWHDMPANNKSVVWRVTSSSQ